MSRGVFALVLAVGGAGCVREAPLSRAPESACASGRPVLQGLRYSTSTSRLDAEKSQRIEILIPDPPSDDPPSFVRIGSERLELRMYAGTPTVAPAEWNWCVQESEPKADTPAAYLAYGTARSVVRGIWFGEGQVAATVFVSASRWRRHAEQRGGRQSGGGASLVFQDAQGRRRGFEWPGLGDVVRLSSGLFVVQPKFRDGTKRIRTHPYYAWGARERAKIQGPFTVGPDGVPHRFQTRLHEMAGWGDNRVWGLSPNERALIGTDRDGRVFFRRRLQGRGRDVMPFRAGACVVTEPSGDEPSGVECLNLAGKQVVKIEVPDATTFVVDADGRVYAGTPSKVFAFAPDGSPRWEDSVAGRSGNFAILPENGLCTARGGTSLSVVCYGMNRGAQRSADPSL